MKRRENKAVTLAILAAAAVTADAVAFPPYRPAGPDTGISGKATGFFHAEETGGVAWVVDPIGRAVFLAGVDWCASCGYPSRTTGRRAYAETVSALYPSLDDWAATNTARLAEWGFTFLSAGSDNVLRHRALPHADGRDSTYFSIWFCAGGDTDRWIVPYCGKPGSFPNVFSPDFERAARGWAKMRCEGNAGDPWLVGYYLDNELDWAPEGPYSLFDRVRALPESHSARKALEDFVGGRNVTAAIRRGFVALVADRYFSVLCSAIRGEDADHMILGCRFAGIPEAPEIAAACGRHCDIVSVNCYPWVDPNGGGVFVRRGGVPFADAFRAFHAAAGKPLLLTEWSFPALDSGLPCTVGAGQRFKTQKERAQASERLLRTVMALPFFVGHSYFSWLDDPADGITDAFLENSNYGLVNDRDESYAELTAMFARVHAGAAALRLAPHCSEMANATTVPKPQTAIQGERGHFFAEAYAARKAGGAATSPSPVGFRQQADGAWTLSNGLVRISGRAGGALMADEIAFGGRVAGRWSALLEWEHEAKVRWTETTRVTDVSFSPDEPTGVGAVTIRAEGAADGIRFAITDRLALAPGSPEMLAEIVRLENTGPAPIPVRYLFLRPFAAQVAPPKVSKAAVPDLWQAPREADWLLSDGSRFGISTRDEAVSSAILWCDAHGAQHPDVRCLGVPPFTLAPGETFLPPRPIGARLRFSPSPSRIQP